jgi:nitrogen PTS system EIIA component
MADERMNLKELSVYLKRPADELERMAMRDKIPACRTSGEWPFERAEIHHCLETRLQTLSESELAALDGSSPEQHSAAGTELVVTPFLAVKTMAVPLLAKTRPSVLRSLVELAGKSGEVYLPAVILDAVSTALPCGVALPHWRCPLAKTLATSMIAYGRTASGIPFGAPDGGLTDIFFLGSLPRRSHAPSGARPARAAAQERRRRQPTPHRGQPSRRDSDRRSSRTRVGRSEFEKTQNPKRVSRHVISVKVCQWLRQLTRNVFARGSQSTRHSRCE